MKTTLEIKLQAAQTRLMSLISWNFSGQNDAVIDDMQLQIAILEVHLARL